MNALIQLFTLHLCVLGKWGQRKDLLGLAVGGQCHHWACEGEIWEDSDQAHFGLLSVSGCLGLSLASVNCSESLFFYSSPFSPFTANSSPKQSSQLISPFQCSRTGGSVSLRTLLGDPLSYSQVTSYFQSTPCEIPYLVHSLLKQVVLHPSSLSSLSAFYTAHTYTPRAFLCSVCEKGEANWILPCDLRNALIPAKWVRFAQTAVGQRSLQLVPRAQGLVCIILSPKGRAELRLTLCVWVPRYIWFVLHLPRVAEFPMEYLSSKHQLKALSCTRYLVQGQSLSGHTPLGLLSGSAFFFIGV